jgi:hypothetical protein
MKQAKLREMTRMRSFIWQPYENGDVNLHEPVRGFIPRKFEIRILVYSPDGKYHIQDNPTVTHRGRYGYWQVQVQIGLETSESGLEHQIVLIVGEGASKLAGVLDSIPEGFEVLTVVPVTRK